LQARLAALRDLQANVEADEKLDPWLKAQGLEALPRLFRRLQVEGGWEVAFEAVLRERIEALEVGRLDVLGALATDAPPARVAFFSSAQAVGGDSPQLPGHARLSERVRGHDAALAGVLSDWLTHVYVADDVPGALAARAQLPAGGQFVTRAGHLVSRHGVRFYAPDDRKAGLLARRQEIENLERELRAHRLLVEQAEAALVRAEAALRQAQEAQQQQRQASERLRGQLHGLQLEAVRLTETIERVKHRAGQIEAELDEVRQQEEELRAQRNEADGRFEQLDQELAASQEAVEAARVAYEESDTRLRAARETQQRLAGEASRIEFELASARERIADLRQASQVAAGDAAGLAAEIERAQLERAKLDDSAARSGLEQWLGQRSHAEAALAQSRSRQDELQQRLRATDEQRVLLEREVQPRREKIVELQLKEQAARLAAEQFAQQLVQAQADEAALADRLAAEPVRANALQAEIARLAQAIADLGAVNLAALDELNGARERKGFLDSQSADLKAAIDTLEDAIRKIDRETRELLASTFEQVNGHFGQLFPKLFGGGEARLMMTGEEILDAGVQVMAQPPGKRNSTIHLLSGGEKALTATALVFALFKLNPAPFCLLDEVDAPLDDQNIGRFVRMLNQFKSNTQFIVITHNPRTTTEAADAAYGVTMQEPGVSSVVSVRLRGNAVEEAIAGKVAVGA